MVIFESIGRPKEIYKYESLSTAEKIIFDQTIKFSFPGTFNDPFDCNLDNIYFELTDKIDPLVLKEIQVLEEDFGNISHDKLVTAFRNSFFNNAKMSAVSCFSLLKDNTLMWSHYAERHSGICLQFDFSLEKPFLNVKIDLEGTVYYGFSDQINYLEDKKAGMWRAFLTKSIDWQYEKEIRFLTLQGEGIYKYRPEFLKKVIFGINSKENDMQRIINKYKEKKFQYLEFEKANKHNGSIVFTKL